MGNSKIVFGNQTILDLTSDTITPSDVRQGVTFHDRSGESKVGTQVINFFGAYNKKGNMIYTWDEIKNNVSLLKNADFKCNLITPSIGIRRLFSNCISIESVVIFGTDDYVEDGETYSLAIVDYKSFEGCTSLEKALIIGDYNSFGSYAFRDCTSLKQITLLPFVIRNDTRSMNNFVFSGCVNLKSAILPQQLDEIGGYAFSDCTSLDLVVPDTVTTIEQDAFYNVPHITYHGTATGALWGALSMN